MATILLTDAEYAHIKTLKQDLLTKAQAASPRAATVYQIGAKLFGDFIAKEDGKRAAAKEKAATREEIQKAKDVRREEIQKAKDARRNNNGQSPQNAPNGEQRPTRPTSTSKAS